MKALLIIFGLLIFIIGFFLLVPYFFSKGEKQALLEDPRFIISRDSGRNWILPQVSDEQKRLLGYDFLDFSFDPTKKNDIIFASTRGGGILVSYDLGFSWARLEGQGALSLTSDVFKVVVSSRPPYPVYVAAFQEGYGGVFKSESTQPLFFHQVYRVSQDHFGVFDIQVDPHDNNHVTIATGEGGLLESRDGGASWKVVKWFSDSIIKLIVKPDDTQLYVVLLLNGKVFKSTNGGKDWLDISEALVSGDLGFFGKAQKAVSLIQHPTKLDTLFLATTSGLFKSETGGGTWKKVAIAVSPDANAGATAVAVDPADPQRMVVALGGTLYVSEDGGTSWSLVGQIKSGTLGTLIFHPKNPRIVLWGIYK